ncbi:MAG: stage III sporulation AC/AD family protein [Oscillospiraceae bacterium]|nr:stage III sporulation AC/AD family protein [Oscillospiraceae bacterium]
MVSDVTAVSGFCIAGALLAVLLKQYCREQSMMLSLGVCIIVFAGAVSIISPVMERLTLLFTQSGLDESYISLVFKATAICFITQITSDLCRDSGENAVASVMELWGRISVMLISVPLIESIVESITDFL